MARNPLKNRLVFRIRTLLLLGSARNNFVLARQRGSRNKFSDPALRRDETQK
jgi:hypothetical protein